MSRVDTSQLKAFCPFCQAVYLVEIKGGTWREGDLRKIGWDVECKKCGKTIFSEEKFT